MPGESQFMKRLLIGLVLLSALGLSLALVEISTAQAGTASLASSALAAVSTPAATPSDNQVNQVASQLYCPVCENIPLDVCPTQACAQWRDLIRQKLASGWSADQIKQYFAAQYGDRVLAEPPNQGPNRWVNLMFYVLIGVSILGGVFVLVRVLAAMRRPRAAGPAKTPPAAGGSYVDRVEEDLRRLK